MNAILCGMEESKFVKVMYFELAKDIWKKLQNFYEGNDKVKQANLKTHSLAVWKSEMKEEENIASYLLLVDEVVDTIKWLGEKIDESMIVQKVLRSLPLNFDAKVSSLEERKDHDRLTIDELHGVLLNEEGSEPYTIASS